MRKRVADLEGAMGAAQQQLQAAAQREQGLTQQATQAVAAYQQAAAELEYASRFLSCPPCVSVSEREPATAQPRNPPPRSTRARAQGAKGVVRPA